MLRDGKPANAYVYARSLSCQCEPAHTWIAITTSAVLMRLYLGLGMPRWELWLLCAGTSMEIISEPRRSLFLELPIQQHLKPPPSAKRIYVASRCKIIMDDIKQRSASSYGAIIREIIDHSNFFH